MRERRYCIDSFHFVDFHPQRLLSMGLMQPRDDSGASWGGGDWVLVGEGQDYTLKGKPWRHNVKESNSVNANPLYKRQGTLTAGLVMDRTVVLHVVVHVVLYCCFCFYCNRLSQQQKKHGCLCSKAFIFRVKDVNCSVFSLA